MLCIDPFVSSFSISIISWLIVKADFQISFLNREKELENIETVRLVNELAQAVKMEDWMDEAVEP